MLVLWSAIWAFYYFTSKFVPIILSFPGYSLSIYRFQVDQLRRHRRIQISSCEIRRRQKRSKSKGQSAANQKSEAGIALDHFLKASCYNLTFYIAEEKVGRRMALLKKQRDGNDEAKALAANLQLNFGVSCFLVFFYGIPRGVLPDFCQWLVEIVKPWSPNFQSSTSLCHSKSTGWRRQNCECRQEAWSHS